MKILLLFMAIFLCITNAKLNKTFKEPLNVVFCCQQVSEDKYGSCNTTNRVGGPICSIGQCPDDWTCYYSWPVNQCSECKTVKTFSQPNNEAKLNIKPNSNERPNVKYNSNENPNNDKKVLGKEGKICGSISCMNGGTCFTCCSDSQDLCRYCDNGSAICQCLSQGSNCGG